MSTFSSSTGPGPAGANLSEVCETIAKHFHLDEIEVLRAAAAVVPVSRDGAGRGHPSTDDVSLTGHPRLVSLAEVVHPPEDYKIEDMNVLQLSDLIAQQPNPENQKVMPFLLRFCLGEFHYGQRATRLLPGQKPMKKVDSGLPTEAVGEHQDHANKVAQAFNVLANESKFRHLHQVAGWVDLADRSVWDAYVMDVMDGKLRAGDRLFEAGCGVLAFLRSAQECSGMSGLVLGGVDGAKNTIKLVKEELVGCWWRGCGWRVRCVLSMWERRPFFLVEEVLSYRKNDLGPDVVV